MDAERVIGLLTGVILVLFITVAIFIMRGKAHEDLQNGDQKSEKRDEDK
jgi:hypothetical protein